MPAPFTNITAPRGESTGSAMPTARTILLQLVAQRKDIHTPYPFHTQGVHATAKPIKVHRVVRKATPLRRFQIRVVLVCGRVWQNFLYVWNEPEGGYSDE